MEKNIINVAVFNVLHGQGIVFKKQDFAAELNSILTQQNIELHEKSIQQIIKQLEAADYVETESELLIKTEKALTHGRSSQRQLLETLLEEYCKEFDEAYIKQLFINHTKTSESTPAELHKNIEDAYNAIINELRECKKVRHKDCLGQIELTN